MSIIQKILKLAGKSPRLKSAYHNSSFLQNLMVSIQQKHYRNMDPADYPAELKRWYEKTTGQPLNLENPQTFNEKIQWMKLYDSTPLKTRLADKYLVRDWIAEKIGEEYLIPLLGVWDTFDDIDFDSLPNQFVLKANHGSGWNVIVRDKAVFDKGDAKKKFNQWMKTNFAYCNCLELHYGDMIPKIIAETYLENSNGELSDYKFHCYSGKVQYIQCMTGRENHDTLREIVFDCDWNLLPFTQNYPRSSGTLPKPSRLAEMIIAAQVLSKEFYYVRVDFYVLDDDSFKFGEMTFTPGSGMGPWNLPEYNLKYGQLIHLPLKSEDNNDMRI